MLTFSVNCPKLGSVGKALYAFLRITFQVIILRFANLKTFHLTVEPSGRTPGSRHHLLRYKFTLVHDVLLLLFFY